MKNTYFLIIALLFSSAIIGQEKVEEKKEPIAKFYGYVAYRAFTDTYESVEAREGDIYLFPKAESLDANGDDINKYFQYKALTLDTRMGVKLNGPDAFGAKITGLIEADWLGTSNNYTRMPRLRHAMIKMNWEKVNLLMGQYWHPMFTTECFPKVLNFGAALPFNPLNRSPQIRLTFAPVKELYMYLAASSYGYHNFSGTNANAQRNSGIPDIHGQVTFKNDVITAGLVAGIKSAKPRLVTDGGIKTSETFTSADFKGFLKLNISKLTLSWAGIYGKNMTPYVMIGGYGANTHPTDINNPNYVDDYSYVGLATLSLWFDGEINLNPVKIGFFAGYSSLLGAGDTYYSLGSRAGNLNNIMRFSPRVTYTSGKLTLGLEYMLSTASYGTQWDENYKVEESADMVMNNRTMFVAKYVF